MASVHTQGPKLIFEAGGRTCPLVGNASKFLEKWYGIKAIVIYLCSFFFFLHYLLFLCIG